MSWLYDIVYCPKMAGGHHFIILQMPICLDPDLT